MDKILALDLGQKTGWALSGSASGVSGPPVPGAQAVLSRVAGRDTNDLIMSGTHEFRPGRYEGGGMVWLRFKSWLNEVYGLSGGLDAVYFEEVRRHLGTLAAHSYGGFLAVLTAWCEGHAIAYRGVPVGTIKRHVTGKGNAKKVEMIAAVQAMGFDPKDDNEADALALLCWVRDVKSR